MPVTRATVRLNRENPIDEDAVINVWHFSHITELDQTGADKLFAALASFYATIAPYLGSHLGRAVGDHTVTLATVTPGGPGPEDDVVSRVQFTGTFPIGVGWSAPTDTADFPAEVAVCLSYRALIDGIPEQAGMTRPASRRRGRVYLGPFNASVAASPLTTNDLQVGTGFRTAALNIYESTVEGLSAATPTFSHCIYSPTSGTTYSVVEAHIDDAFDTIRSRGSAPSGRTSKSIILGSPA